MQLFSEKAAISSETYFSGSSYVKPSVHLRCCGRVQIAVLKLEEAGGGQSRGELVLSRARLAPGLQNPLSLHCAFRQLNLE